MSEQASSGLHMSEQIASYSFILLRPVKNKVFLKRVNKLLFILL